MANLEIKNITKRYQGDTVLDDISLSVAEGETLVLFGPSGAGKTVLLRLIAGVVDADQGQVMIDGADLTEIEAEERGIGMAFQNFALFPHMSAFDNIASPLTARRQTGQDIKDRVHDVAQLLKIEHVLDHAPRALSNGQKQRTALARALVASPPILLLDDPLRNVDAKLRFEMRLELPKLLADRNATVIYVTQDYKEAMALGDQIIVMSSGRVQQRGTPEDIYITPAEIEIARLFGDPTINLLDVKGESDRQGLYVKIADVIVRLDSLKSSGDGQDCVLGLRPENLRFTNQTEAGAIPVKIDAETPLNEKTVTLARTEDDREILISRPAGTDGPTEGVAYIGIDAKSALLFDRTSGLRLTEDINPSEERGTVA